MRAIDILKEAEGIKLEDEDGEGGNIGDGY